MTNPQISPDGLWRWDGTAWVPNDTAGYGYGPPPTATAPAPGAPPSYGPPPAGAPSDWKAVTSLVLVFSAFDWT